MPPLAIPVSRLLAHLGVTSLLATKLAETTSRSLRDYASNTKPFLSRYAFGGGSQTFIGDSLDKYKRLCILQSGVGPDRSAVLLRSLACGRRESNNRSQESGVRRSTSVVSRQLSVVVRRSGQPWLGELLEQFLGVFELMPLRKKQTLSVANHVAGREALKSPGARKPFSPYLSPHQWQSESERMRERRKNFMQKRGSKPLCD